VCFRLNLKLRALEMLHQASRTLCRDAASLKKKKQKKKTVLIVWSGCVYINMKNDLRPKWNQYWVQMDIYRL